MTPDATQPDLAPDPTTVLDPLPVDDSVKADAWDAFHSAAGPSHFKSLMDPLGLPDEAKADLWDMKFGASVTPPEKGGDPDQTALPASEPEKPNQVQRVSPATPNPPTAALATVPEQPGTLAIQLGQLGGGQRRVVMFPKGNGQPPVLPQNTAITHDAFGNTYAYRPDLIKKSEIHTAAKNNTLPQLLGGPLGMGAPDKSALQAPTSAVVARAPDGTEAQSTATDPASLPQTVAATRPLVPPGGSLRVENPSRVINQRNGPMLADGALPAKGATQNESSEFFRGKWNIPLTDKGRADADNVAQRTAGQFTSIHASPLGRAQETAARVAAANPQAGSIQTTEALEPWTLGQHEGEPVTQDRVDDLADRIRNRPDEPIPGAGRYSNAPGESFNDFKDPLITHVIQQLQNWQPGDKPLNVTHYRDIVALRAWLAAGAHPDRSIDTDVMTAKGKEKPGQMFVLDPRSMELSDAKDAARDGIYYLRHGETAANEGAAAPAPVSNLLSIVRSAAPQKALAAFATASPDEKTSAAGILRKRLMSDRGRRNWTGEMQMLAAKHFGLRPPPAQNQDFASPQQLQ